MQFYTLLLGFSILAVHHLSDAQQLQPTCSEHFTCMSTERKPETLQLLKLNASVPNWYELCSCDAFCHLFGDCCSDAPVLRHLELEHWSFVKVRLTSKITYLSLMKNRCPRTWKGSSAEGGAVRQLCESSPLSTKYDLLLPDIEHQLLLGPEDELNSWHVTSRTSMVTYRNLHCAICNEDTQVEAWTQRLKCSNSADAKNDSPQTCTAVSSQTSPDILGKEKLKRTLLQKVFASCNLGWYKLNIDARTAYVTETVKRCLIYYEPVVVRDLKSKKFIIFKNRYCALCNDYEAAVQQCPGEAVDQQTQVPPTFTLVSDFDANYQTGGFNDRTNRTCARGEVYNPMQGVCLKVMRPLNGGGGSDRNLAIGGFGGGGGLKAAGALSKGVSSSATTILVTPIFFVFFLIITSFLSF